MLYQIPIIFTEIHTLTHYLPELFLALSSSVWLLTLAHPAAAHRLPSKGLRFAGLIILFFYLFLWYIRFSSLSLCMLNFHFGVFHGLEDFCFSFDREYLKLFLVCVVLPAYVRLALLSSRPLNEGDGLILFALLALLLAVDTRSLLTLYILLELSGFSLILSLAAHPRCGPEMLSRLFSYGLTNALVSLYFLSGLAFIYLGFGQFDLAVILALSDSLYDSSCAGSAMLMLIASAFMLPFIFFKLSLPPFLGPSLAIARYAPNEWSLIFSHLQKIPLVAPTLAFYSKIILFLKPLVEASELSPHSILFFLCLPVVFGLFNFAGLLRRCFSPNYFNLSMAELFTYLSMGSTLPILVLPLLHDSAPLRGTFVFYVVSGALAAVPAYFLFSSDAIPFYSESLGKRLQFLNRLATGRLAVFLAFLLLLGLPPSLYFYIKFLLLQFCFPQIPNYSPQFTLLLVIFATTVMQILLFSYYFFGKDGRYLLDFRFSSLDPSTLLSSSIQFSLLSAAVTLLPFFSAAAGYSNLLLPVFDLIY